MTLKVEISPGDRVKFIPPLGEAFTEKGTIKAIKYCSKRDTNYALIYSSTGVGYEAVLLNRVRHLNKTEKKRDLYKR